MRIEQEQEKRHTNLPQGVSELTDTARRALITLCSSLGQLRLLAPDAPPVISIPCRELLEQLIDGLTLANVASLQLANDAVYARSLFLNDHRYNYVLDHTFEYLDILLDQPSITPADAHLIDTVFSTVTLPEEDAAPYLALLHHVNA